MASPASKSATTKQLKEHLQEQQEPCPLNIYLSERGHLIKCLSSNGRNDCCQINLFKNLRRPRGYNLNKKMALLSTRVVKSVLHKLVPANDSQELSYSSNDNAQQDEFQTAETSGFTAVNGLITPFGASPSCSVEEEYLPSNYRPGSSSQTSQTSNLGNVEPEKNLTDKTCQRKRTQDKHLDLMSTLNDLSYDKVHHIITRQESPSSRNSTPTENAKGNFLFATFPWKLLGKSQTEKYALIGLKEAKETIEPCSPQHRRNQGLVNQRKPLFNLPEKSTKNNDWSNVRNNYNYIHWFIGVEKQGNLIRAEQIYSCRKNSRDSSMNFPDTLEEWNYSQQLQCGLGDSIMDEIVEEIIDLLCQ